MIHSSATSSSDSIRASAGHNAKISFVSGNFNVLHPGHLRLLRFAAEVGDFLVVGVNPDETPGVTLPQSVRAECVRAISIVNVAIQLDEPPEHFIARLKPDVVVKGREFESRVNAEQEVIDGYGGRLIFNSGETQFATLELLDREFTETNFTSIRKPMDYPARHGFDMGALKTALSKLSGIRVTVIGDLIIDDYITCEPVGMSQEDPTIVVTPIETKTFVGGAGVVSAHAKSLGANVNYISVVGSDEASSSARTSLESQGIGVHFFNDETRPTTRKQRFRAHGKTMLRVNHLRQHPISMQLMRKIIRLVESMFDHTDLLLFSDFNYGCLPQPLVDAISNRALNCGIMMAADSQASSQMADISRFKRMHLITPTEREARMALRDHQSGLPVVASKLVEASHAETIVITLGSEGMLIHAKKNDQYLADRLPAFNIAPKDAAGAGDSLFTSTSLAMCAGVDIWQAIYLGALTAACQVGRVGNAPLSHKDVVTELDTVN